MKQNDKFMDTFILFGSQADIVSDEVLQTLEEFVCHIHGNNKQK